MDRSGKTTAGSAEFFLGGSAQRQCQPTECENNGYDRLHTSSFIKSSPIQV
jgi:hypothetical protein